MVIPAAYRDALGKTESDAVLMRLDGEELGLTSDETEVRLGPRDRQPIRPRRHRLVEEILRERRGNRYGRRLMSRAVPDMAVDVQLIRN